MNRLIFGCGYLGKRVAKKWLEDGDKVYALTRFEDRAEEFKRLGISPIVGDITQSETFADSVSKLPSLDTVLFAVGMDRSRYSDIRAVYVEGLNNVIEQLQANPEPIKQLIYVSSTGVYGDFGGSWVDETAETKPKRDGGKACVEAEQLIQTGPLANRAMILRFAGIYGRQRVPTKKVIANKSWDKLSLGGYLNLIHVDDGADIVKLISNSSSHLNLDQTTETFNVSDGAPSKRKDYYQFVAKQLGIDDIEWNQDAVVPENSRANTSKRISNQKLTARFDIKLNYPDYQAGLRQAMSQDPSNH